jgi:soluble lytic murein transglycosylase-like protein
MVLNHRDRVINAFKSVHSGHRIIITVVLLFIGSAIFSTANEWGFNLDEIYREKINTPVMDSRPAGGYSEIVKSVAIRYKVDPNLITAMIEIESKGNSRAVSPRGAKGLM